MSEKDTAVSPEGKVPEAKPKDYVLVQHLQRYAETKTLRASRAGHRRQGVILDDGTRLRRKAYRFTEMSISTLVANHQSILEHVREGRLAIFDPDGQKEATYEQLVDFIQGHMGKGEVVKETSLKNEVQEMVSPAHEAIPAPKSTEITRPDVDTSAVIAAVDQAEAKKTGEANPPPSERPTEPAHPKRPGKRSKS